MKPLIVVSLFGAAVLLGLPAGAQVGGGQQMPAPYAPPVPPQLQQMPQVEQVPPADGQQGAPMPDAPGEVQIVGGPPAGELALPTGDEAQPLYDPSLPNGQNAAANYPPADLGPDNDIAQSYDDGYDPQAYSQFQTELDPYGAWDYDSSYGYVWSPAASIVGAGFSPYATRGHWALTEYGWTWVSDWNWGWAPFHYGRWITRAGRWSWVPGSMWGPAWVSWRSGNGFVGWSPLPPRGVRLGGGFGAGSSWRFTQAGNLGAARPAFVSPRYLPGMFARTTVVSNDRLLTHGRWSVHVNAGPTHGTGASPVSLSRVAPNVMPRVAVYPRAGMAVSERPWARAEASRSDPLTQGWHAGTPVSPTRTAGRTPAYGAGARAPATGWSPRPAQAYGSAGGYGRPYNSGWSVPATRPSYGAPSAYGGQTAYRAPAPAYRAPAPEYRAPAPAYRAPAPAYRAPAPAYSPPSRSWAPPSGGGSHFGGSGGGHFGGFGGGGRRR